MCRTGTINCSFDNFVSAVLVCIVAAASCSAYIPEYTQQLGIYSQAPAAGYFNYGAPSLYVPRYKRSYNAGGYGGNGGSYGGGGGYGGYGNGGGGGGIGTSYAHIASLPYGSGSTNNLYGSSGTNSYNPLPTAVSFIGGGGGGGLYGGGLYRKKRSAHYIPEFTQQLGIYSQAPAAGYFNYGAPSLYVPRYKRSINAGITSAQPVYGGNGDGYGDSSYGSAGYGSNVGGYGGGGYGNNGGYGGGVGTSYAHIASLPYGSGSTNNLYGSSGTNSYNPLPSAVSFVGGGYGGLY